MLCLEIEIVPITLYNINQDTRKETFNIKRRIEDPQELARKVWHLPPRSEVTFVRSALPNSKFIEEGKSLSESLEFSESKKGTGERRREGGKGSFSIHCVREAGAARRPRSTVISSNQEFARE